MATALVAMGLVLASAPMFAGASPPRRLAGLFDIDAAGRARWGYCGAWVYPVGDPRDFQRSAAAGEPGFRVNRGLGGSGDGAPAHQGADLANGRGGDLVHAAAHGLVVFVARSGWGGGYGRHVVIAHRMEDGAVVYSVYAHLAPKSLRVRTGAHVAAGQPLGRVGRSGRATTEHLHFEVRPAPDPDERWENVPPVDPVAFVAARLPAARDPDQPLSRYLDWAECSGLVAADALPDAALDRFTWWRMLAHAARHDLDPPPTGADALRDALIDEGVLPDGQARGSAGALPWSELARDIARLRAIGIRLTHPPFAVAIHHRACETRFGSPSPSRATEKLGRHEARGPRLTDACLLLADLCGPWDAPRAKRTVVRRGPAITHPSAGDTTRG